MDFDYLKILITILLAALGWIVAHRLTSNRDRKNAQRDLRTKYLIEAYRNIEVACGYTDFLPAHLNRRIESAIAGVQLFGSKKQIEIARSFTNKTNRSQYGDPRELLIDLRSQLRKELKLEEVSSNPKDIFHWRLKDLNS